MDLYVWTHIFWHLSNLSLFFNLKTKRLKSISCIIDKNFGITLKSQPSFIWFSMTLSFSMMDLKYSLYSYNWYTWRFDCHMTSQTKRNTDMRNWQLCNFVLTFLNPQINRLKYQNFLKQLQNWKSYLWRYPAYHLARSNEVPSE